MLIAIIHMEVPINPRAYDTGNGNAFGPFVEKTMSGMTKELCILISGVLYVVKSVLIVNSTDGRSCVARSINVTDTLAACAGQWGLMSVDNDEDAVLECFELPTSSSGGRPLLRWGMAGTFDDGITIAVPGFGAEGAYLGDNKMHIGGEIWGAMAACRLPMSYGIIPYGRVWAQHSIAPTLSTASTTAWSAQCQSPLCGFKAALFHSVPHGGSSWDAY
jgi:hypothetical protein